MKRRVFVALCVGALCLASAGCSGKLGDLQGERTAVVHVKAAEAAAPANAAAAGAGPVAEYPTTFSLRNGAWGGVRVESMRIPISTEVQTEPTLPATIKPGGSLAVTVVSKIRTGGPMAVRNIYLESSGQEPLKLVVKPELAK